MASQVITVSGTAVAVGAASGAVGVVSGVSGFGNLPDSIKAFQGSGNSSGLEELTGGNWSFNPEKDLDLRGTGKDHHDALDEAFRRTGVPKDEFKVTKWGKDKNGKSVPVEWKGPNGESVNMDIPKYNNVKSNGQLGDGPHQPHIGYTTGKKKTKVTGHIFIDNVPATRR